MIFTQKFIPIVAIGLTFVMVLSISKYELPQHLPLENYLANLHSQLAVMYVSGTATSSYVYWAGMSNLL